MDDRTDDVCPPSRARHLRRIEVKGSDDATNAAAVGLGVVNVVGRIQRNALRLLNAGDDAHLFPLGIELVNRVVAQGVDEDVSVPADQDIIRRRQGRESPPGGVEGPHRTTLVRDEDPFGCVDRRSDRSHHAACDFGRRLAVCANAPHHAVRTVRYQDVAVRQLGSDAIDAGSGAGIRKRAPDADRVRLGIHRDPDHAVAALLGNQKGARPVLPPLLHDALWFRKAGGDPFHRPIGIKDRDGAGVDVAEVQAGIEAEGKVIRCRKIVEDNLWTAWSGTRGAVGQRGGGWTRRRRGLGRRGDGRWLTGGQHSDGDQPTPPAVTFDRCDLSVYDGVVLKVISAPELARNLDPILQALEESGTTLIIKHHDQPAALLVRFDAYVAMLATMDYSGWERWIEEVRAAFPTSVFAPPRRP